MPARRNQHMAAGSHWSHGRYRRPRARPQRGDVVCGGGRTARRRMTGRAAATVAAAAAPCGRNITYRQAGAAGLLIHPGMPPRFPPRTPTALGALMPLCTLMLTLVCDGVLRPAAKRLPRRLHVAEALGEGRAACALQVLPRRTHWRPRLAAICSSVIAGGATPSSEGPAAAAQSGGGVLVPSSRPLSFPGSGRRSRSDIEALHARIVGSDRPGALSRQQRSRRQLQLR